MATEITTVVSPRIMPFFVSFFSSLSVIRFAAIFSSTFLCTMLKEKDILWALSFAGGAAQAALESGQIGLEKIPSKGAIESNAYYFYNTIKFKEI